MKTIFRILFDSVWLNVIWWLVASIAVTLSGYPGGLCLTPITWLLGITAGKRAFDLSMQAGNPHPVLMAGLAGGLTGFANGAASTLAAFLTLWIPRLEDVASPWIFAVFAIVGAIIGAALGVVTGLISRSRLHPTE